MFRTKLSFFCSMLAGDFSCAMLAKYEQCSEPLLEFKGSARHVEKGHPTLIIQVDLIF